MWKNSKGVVGVVFGLIFSLVVLGIWGCSRDGRFDGAKRYVFGTFEGVKFEVRSNLDYLLVAQKNKPITKNFLVFFLDLEDINCLEYTQTLKNLQKDYMDLQVVALSVKKLSREKMREFAIKNEINFLLLSPLDSRDMFKDFGARLEGDGSSVGLPFLLLYDKSGKKIQSYRGAVPQEMFMFDLSNLK